MVYHEFGHAIDTHTNMRTNSKVKEVMDKHRSILGADRDKGYKEAQKTLIAKYREAKKNKDDDTIEKMIACYDTLKSLNINYGDGHTKAYFMRKGNQEAEFIAHAFENTYAGNDIFKEVMPELYEDMIEMIKYFMPK